MNLSPAELIETLICPYCETTMTCTGPGILSRFRWNCMKCKYWIEGHDAERIRQYFGTDYFKAWKLKIKNRKCPKCGCTKINQQLEINRNESGKILGFDHDPICKECEYPLGDDWYDNKDGDEAEG